MNLVILVLGLLLLLFFFKNLKHHLFRKTITLVFAIFIILMVLMFTSSYLDIGSVFSKDSLAAKTGAAVVYTVGSNVDTSSLKSFFSDAYSSVMNVSDSVISDSSGDSQNGFIKIN